MKDRSKHILCIEQIVFSHSECVCSAVKGRFGVDELGGSAKFVNLKRNLSFEFSICLQSQKLGGKNLINVNYKDVTLQIA